MKKIKSYLGYAILAVASFSLLGLGGCADKYYEIDESVTIIGPTIISKNYPVLKTDWTWNDKAKRYEVVFGGVNELHSDLYEFGTVVGTVFVLEEDQNGSQFEVQKTLPYVRAHNDASSIYTEMISFDISYDGEGFVAFYIQASDLGRFTPLTSDYEFKITFISDTEGL